MPTARVVHPSTDSFHPKDDLKDQFISIWEANHCGEVAVTHSGHLDMTDLFTSKIEPRFRCICIQVKVNLCTFPSEAPLPAASFPYLASGWAHQ